MACNAIFAALWCFTREQHVNGCFFANIDLFLCFLLCAWSRLRQEFDSCVPLWDKRHYFRVYLFLIVFFCLCAPQRIG